MARLSALMLSSQCQLLPGLVLRPDQRKVAVARVAGCTRHRCNNAVPASGCVQWRVPYGQNLQRGVKAALQRNGEVLLLPR